MCRKTATVTVEKGKTMRLVDLDATESYLLDGRYVVNPVKHGHWVPTEQTSNFEWECSVCGNGFTNNKLNYCYDCGARMDEEVE